MKRQVIWRKTGILLLLVVLLTSGLTPHSVAETTTHIKSHKLSSETTKDFRIFEANFLDWQFEEPVTVRDAYGAVHEVRPAAGASDGYSAIELKLNLKPAVTAAKESIFYVEIYRKDAGELIYDASKLFLTESEQTLQISLSDQYFDQEFFYIRMGTLDSWDDNYITGEADRKLRNPYFSGVPASQQTDSLVISNQSLSGDSVQSTGTFSMDSLNSSATFSENMEPGAYRIDILPEYKPTLQQKSQSLDRTNSIAVKTYNVGASKNFWVIHTVTGKPYQIPAVLKYSGTKSQVWVHGNEITSRQAEEMGTEFDTAIHPLITRNFAVESDVDRNGKIAILVYDVQDGFSGSGGFISGYFSSRDLYDAAYSNVGEVFYIDTYPTMGYNKTDYNAEQAYGTIAHEFQHMVNYNRNVLVEGSSEMAVWLNEAMAMAAEHMYLNGPLTDRLDYYKASNAIRDGHSLLYWDYSGDVLSNYALSYLFGQYLRVQAGKGHAIYRELLEKRMTDTAALESIISTYIKSGQPLGEFLTDFRHALTQNDPSGLYGFHNETGLADVRSPMYSGKLPRNLRGGGAISIPLTDVSRIIIPTDKGASVKYRQIDSGSTAFIPTTRMAGTNRYATAAVISKAGWTSADTVIIATGQNFPDALAGGPLAYQKNAPILLTTSAVLHADTKTEIRRLGAQNAIILGRTEAVSAAVETELQNMGLSVERIGGATRFETAALIASRLPSDQAIIANGHNFPDALSVSPYGARNGIPILLTKVDRLPKETKNALNGRTSTIVVGQTGVVSDHVMGELPNPVRYGGQTRYDTGKVLASSLPLGTDKAFVATGRNFPDALAGSVLAAKENAPILLVEHKTIPSATRELAGRYTSFSILGGTGSVEDTVSQELNLILLNN